MVVARHEQSTGHMAEGYARATGQAGVVIVGTGSSITNMVTPMQDALCDGTPMVVLCTDLWPSQADSNAQETVDVISLTQSCTKWNAEVSSAKDLPTKINQAFQIATHGRPGPVLVYLARTMTACHDSVATRKPHMNPPLGGSTARVLGEEDVGEALARVARLVNMAQRPVLYVGQGMLAQAEGPSILKDLSTGPQYR
jgi:acetolactate synthase I/II/III large subunit